MFNLIPISLLITAIGGIVYIISSHLSEFSEKGGDNEENGDSFQFGFKARFAEWAKELPLDNIKSQSLSLTQKLLHRTRILLLKTDNKLMKIIGKIAERENGDKDGNGDSKKMPVADFWENLSNSKQDEQIARPVIEPEIKIDLVTQSEAAKKFFDIKKPVKKRQRSSVVEQLHGKE